MNKRISRAYFIIPLVYIGVIVLLLFLQFSGDKQFQDTMGIFRLKGKSGSPVEDASGKSAGGKISELSVSTDLIEFPMTQKEPLLVYRDSELVGEAIPREFKKIDSGVELSFDPDMQIRFLQTAEQLQNFEIIIHINAQNPEEYSISLPCSFTEQIEVEPAAYVPVFRIRDSLGSYYLTLHGEGRIEENHRRYSIGIDPDGFAKISLEPAGSPSPLLHWYGKQTDFIDSGTFASGVDSYLDRSYKGWQRARFDRNNGTWLGLYSSYDFSQAVVTAYLSEALLRGDYNNALSQVTGAASKNRGSLTYKTSPFLGNLAETTARVKIEQNKQINELRGKIEAADTSLFRQEHVLQFLLNHGPYNLFERAVTFASTIDYETTDVPTALGLFQLFVEDGLNIPELASLLSKFEDILWSTLLPSISRSREGYFLVYGPKTISVYHSLLLGNLLQQYGQSKSDTLLVSIGRELVLSSLKLSDDQGFLPATLIVEDTNTLTSEGRIAPEEIYTLLKDNPYYPREIALNNEFGPGAWIWLNTAMEVSEGPSGQFRFTFDFPIGGIHHFVLKGIKPYREIRLFNTPWRTTALFESYSSGCDYREEDEIFYIKIRHKKVRETFLINF
jgi:hypothetical protein